MSSNETRDQLAERAKQFLSGIGRGEWTVQEHRDSPHADPMYVVPEIDPYRNELNPIHCGEDRALAEFIAAAPGLIRGLLAEREGFRPPPRVIETRAELDALPEYSIIRWEAPDGLSRGMIERFDGGWWQPGNHARLTTELIPLPATLIWTPEEAEKR